MKKIISMLFAVTLVLGFISNANAAKTLKCQTVLNAKGDEVVMLKDFTDTVTRLTQGSLKSELLETLDVNDFGDYPDIICDICSDITGLEKKYNKIICIAILEHVYNPSAAVMNLKKMLKDNGIIYGYVPYLYQYHAPNDLKFQDYFRFSKDALAYLFKDFQNVELFPIRGRISTPLNILFASKWKKYAEKTNINIYLDKISNDENNFKQCSGFNFIIKK